MRSEKEIKETIKKIIEYDKKFGDSSTGAKIQISALNWVLEDSLFELEQAWFKRFEDEKKFNGSNAYLDYEPRYTLNEAKKIIFGELTDTKNKTQKLEFGLIKIKNELEMLKKELEELK